MRQGRQVVNLGRNYSIFDPFLREQKGNLTIEMTNQGRSVITLQDQRLKDVDMKENGQRIKKDGTQAKTKKKIKSKPMNLADSKYRTIQVPPSLHIMGRVDDQENFSGQNMDQFP